MMTSETFTFRSTGWGRFIDVAFLGLWLTGWLVGEVVVAVLLGGMVAGMIASVFGIELSFASRVGPDGSTPFFVLFMLFWFAMWTLGGIAAGTHFLRSLAGRDTVSVSPDGLEIEWRAGPFRRRRTIAFGAIRRLRMGLRDASVVVETANGSVDLTNLGTRDQRDALFTWLKKRLVLPGESELKRLNVETAPSGWEVEVEGMETRLSRPTRRDRRIVAAILWGLAALTFTGFLPVLYAWPDFSVDVMWNPDLIEVPRNHVTNVHIAAGVVSLLIALGAAWMTWGRAEWVIKPGRLTWRRRFAAWRSERLFENAAIGLERTRDSDGDERFTLRVHGADKPRKISSSLHDAEELISLGDWLSARTHFPFDRPSS